MTVDVCSSISWKMTSPKTCRGCWESILRPNCLHKMWGEQLPCEGGSNIRSDLRIMPIYFHIFPYISLQNGKATWSSQRGHDDEGWCWISDLKSTCLFLFQCPKHVLFGLALFGLATDAFLSTTNFAGHLWDEVHLLLLCGLGWSQCLGDSTVHPW